MANNHDQATVQPLIPESLIHPVEVALLRGFGFEHEAEQQQGCNMLYFYAENGTSDEFSGDLPALPGEVSGPGSELVDELRSYYLVHGMDPETGEEDAFLDDLPTSWTDIFQRIARRMRDAGLDDYAIVVQGAYYCDKMRSGEFGGWVTVISPESIQSGSTYKLAEEFKARAQRAHQAHQSPRP